MPARALLLAVVALTPADAAAQQLDRRSRDEPEIVAEAGGRVGPCDALLFTPDGRFLLAAGDDKVVRVWPHAATGLDTDRTRVQTLRWRAWREQRGGIKALAVSADGKKVAVGGFGMKPSTVAVIDRATGDTLALTWPLTRKGEDGFGAVQAVAFGPDGTVGFGTADGSVWVWTPTPLAKPDDDGRTAAPPVRVGRHEALKDPDGNTEFNFPRLVFFAGDALVSVANSGQVMTSARDAKGDAPNRPPAARASWNVNDGLPRLQNVHRAELVDGGKWLVVANKGPQVILRSLDGKKHVALALGKDQFPRSVAWHPKTRQLAVGVGTALPTPGTARFFAEGDDEIWLYDDPVAKPDAKPRTLKHTGAAEALAFHPTLAHLAVAGGDADEVRLHDLGPDKKPLAGARGAGRRPWAVNLSESGKVVGVQIARDPAAVNPNARGKGAWTRFDLDRLTPTLDESLAWVNPVSSADGWSIVPDAGDSFIWYAQRARDGAKVRLGLDRSRDQAPTCFTFLPAAGAAPTRVLVGHYYGCTLFELVPERAVNGQLAGAKVFTGHAGEVTSVVVAKDQSWFVTGGTDQTVAAWSLKEWKGQAILGAAFTEKDGAAVVASVETASPAWEAGLRAGDVLDLLAVDRKLVFERGKDIPATGTVADALAALKAPRPGIELYFGFAAREQAPRRETLTTVRQRPLWKWFPGFDAQNAMNDWVVWMWHGSYYHTKTANGDRLAGWHVNAPDPGGRPRFYQLQQYEKHFHRPDVVEKVIKTRDPGAALVAARGPTPTPVSFRQYEPAPVRLALKALEVPQTGLPLDISVHRRGNDPDLLPERVELWVNDYLVEAWPPPGKALDPKVPFEKQFTVPAEAFRAGDNQIAVLTFNAAGGRAEEFQLVASTRPAADSKLLALLAGVNDYSDARKVAARARDFGDVTRAQDDATALGKQLERYAGPKLLFKDAKIDLQLNPARAKLDANLAAIAKLARPDDVLVVFFAGHGDLLMPRDGPIPDDRSLLGGEGVFLFCCPDYSPAKPEATALAAEELFAKLAKINCRKVVLLDACHSGRATAASVVRRCVPSGQGPIILAACEQGQLSYEHAKYGHGLFTYAVLDALDKTKGYRDADLNTDGALSADELFQHVGAKVPDLLRRAGLKEPQTPVCFPPQLPKAPLLKR